MDVYKLEVIVLIKASDHNDAQNKVFNKLRGDSSIFASSIQNNRKYNEKEVGEMEKKRECMESILDFN